MFMHLEDWKVMIRERIRMGKNTPANQVAVEFIDWHALEGLDSSEVGRC